VNAIKTKEIKLTKLPLKAKFYLTRHWWKGQKVVRVGPTRLHYDLSLVIPGKRDIAHFVLEYNPIEVPRTTAIYEPWKSKKLLERTGKIPPSTPILNPTKATPAFIEPLDMNKPCTIYEMTNQFIKVKFQGTKLKGLFVLVREMPKNKVWVLERTELIPPVQSELCYFEQTPYLEVSGMLLHPGYIKNLYFSPDVLKKAVLLPMKGSNIPYINLHHLHDELSKVGLIKRIWWNSKHKWLCLQKNEYKEGALMFEGVVVDRNAIGRIIDKEVFKISPELTYTEVNGKIDTVQVRGLALTTTPACKECRIERVCDVDRCWRL